MLVSAEAYIIELLRLVLNNGQKISRYWFKHIFFAEAKIYLSEGQKQIVRKMLRETKNLIKNPSCVQEYNNWTQTKTGGNGWAVNNCDHILAGKTRFTQKAFCGSYSDCEMKQTVSQAEEPFKTLLGSNNYKCIIEAGAYAARRWDCGCTARITVTLENNDSKPIEIRTKVVSEELPPACTLTKSHCYKHLAISVNNPVALSSTKKITLTIWTKDTKCWAGQYAARFTDMFIRIVPLAYYLRPPISTGDIIKPIVKKEEESDEEDIGGGLFD